MGLGKGYDIALAIIVVVWAVVCMWLAVRGSKNKKDPNPKFEKVPIIIGIAVPVLIGILAIIGYFSSRGSFWFGESFLK